MRSRKSPLEYYRTLGVKPGASKKELRTAYLRLVKECHPDQFAQNPQAQTAAQERLKAINEAYTCLRGYRPDGIYEVWSYPEGSAAQWHEYRRRADHEPPIVDPFEGDYQYRPVRGSARGGKFAWAFIVLAVLGALRYIVFPTASGIASGKNAAQASTQRASLAPPGEMQVVFLGEESRGNWTSSSRLVPYFFRGSTKADVYRIQGIPDWSNEQEWHYGDSRVFFAGDGVQRWKNGARSPLKVIDLEHPEAGKALEVGSSFSDVLSVQGKPDSITDSYWQSADGKVTKTRAWHYGGSKVEFAQDRVVGWETAPGSPLKTKQ